MNRLYRLMNALLKRIELLIFPIAEQFLDVEQKALLAVFEA